MSNSHLLLKLRGIIYDRCDYVRPHECDSQCNGCQIGISIAEINISVCPICGSGVACHDNWGLLHTGFRHIIYNCGTTVNICSHYNERPNSITSIVQGLACYQPEDDTI